MNTDRRGFLKAAGVVGLAAAAGAGASAGLAEEGPGASQASPKEMTGTRWAMVVDLKKCQSQSGCRKCMEACHQVHNVPQMPDPRHEVKWIWKEPFAHTFPESINEYVEDDHRESQVPVLCNHCDSPPCVRVCPTQATFSREDGIVVMDPHRCYGCRYCIVACPYGSRSFNWLDPRPHVPKIDPNYPTRVRGVVEKCTFCPERLAEGKLPACVEACQSVVGALIFGDIEDVESEVRKLVASGRTLRRRPALGTRPQVYYLV